jgi:hypothetical protein
METDAGFRAQPEFQTCQQSIRLNTDQRKHYKLYTGAYANECYKCLKLLPEIEKDAKRNAKRNLSAFNKQHDESVIALANETGEVLPAKDKIAYCDEDGNLLYKYTEKVGVDGEEQLDTIIYKGTPILVEEEYYSASSQAYNELVQSDTGLSFLLLSTKSKIRKIKAHLIQKFILNGDLLFYLDTSKPLPTALSSSTSGSSDTANQLSASATRDNSTVPGALVPDIAVMQAAPPAPATIALNGLDAVVLAGQLANNASSVTFVNVQSGAQHIGVQNNSTDGGGRGTPEWAKRIMTEQQVIMTEQQVQGGQLRQVHANTTTTKVPSSASRYTPPDPENLATAFESNSSSQAANKKVPSSASRYTPPDLATAFESNSSSPT